MPRGGEWTKFWRLYVDGTKTEVALCARTKAAAYRDQFEDQWRLAYPDKPVPSRRRCSLEYEEEWVS